MKSRCISLERGSVFIKLFCCCKCYVLPMADSDWKKRVGIQINFTSDSSDDEGVSGKSENERDEGEPISPRLPDSTECSLDTTHLTEEEFFSQMSDNFGTTPPRTRIRRKERRHREKEEQSIPKKSPKVFYTMKTKRRNTLDSIYFDDLLEKSETSGEVSLADVDIFCCESSKRTRRSMKILRHSERDMKLEQASVRHSVPPMFEQDDDRTESMPIDHPQLLKVESCKRFMSLSSKLVACQKMRRACQGEEWTKDQDSRVDFFHKVNQLIRLGGCDKQNDKHTWRQLSKEEHLWQNELKDLIWLELQAWHADRTLTEQDEFLCKARENVGALLDQIMNYRFINHPAQECHLKKDVFSAQNSDSGLSCEGNEEGVQGEVSDNTSDANSCPYVGCLSIYCQNCVENRLAALKDVQKLLTRLEAAEALYPSSKAFALQYPLYKSPQFIGRVKSMCLWYNMTQHHRLKLLILGKHLTFLQSKKCNWPACEEDSGVATDTSVSDDATSRLSRGSSLQEQSCAKNKKRVVQFDMDSITSSPSDSNNSNTSHTSSDGAFDGSDCFTEHCDDHTPTSVSSGFFSQNLISSSVNPIRKYIEVVLKTRGVRKSLNFLEKLHRHILVKAMVSLSKPNTTTSIAQESFEKTVNDSVDTIEDSPNHPLDEQEEELRRYGYWSEDTQALHLPSYRSAFLFLTHIPLDTVYQLLQMRLEQKPQNPSVLCIRQLMRELKEGLRMAALHRERYLTLIRSVLWDVDKETLKKYEDVLEFDETCRAVLQLYLQYLQQWVPMVQHERFQKNLLEEEWQFVKTTCITIPEASDLVGTIFCHIASGMLEAISIYLATRVNDIMQHKHEETSDEESSTKQVLMSACREFQTLFNEARQKSLKAVSFTKTLIKDLEKDDFFQTLEKSAQCKLVKALEELKLEGLTLRHNITSAIHSIEKTCLKWNKNELDEVDKFALTSRCREILHLGYKYSFEYHREICRVVTGSLRTKLCIGYVGLAYQWMDFVKEWCERGKGVRPRWAIQGLDFLTFVCDPSHTCHMTEEEFKEFECAVENCVAHVIGTASPVGEKRPSSPYIYQSGRGSLDGQRSRSRASSPASRTKSPAYRVSRSVLDIGSPLVVQPTQRSLSVIPTLIVNDNDTEDLTDASSLSIKIPSRISRIERVRAAVKNLENNIDNKMLSQELIGSVTDVCSADRVHIKSKSVTFSWQRGMKIGQGRFGKVYTVVNNETGELLAMKEIQLQPNDHRTIRRVAEELRTFEGITHKYLVRYYGVEIHREEMLIFMEFCAEGTLESFVAATECGLPETLIRCYTHQLMEAVSALHQHGVVHRDIKSANIFLTEEGNSLKLGDFGSAVKIKAHTTMPGELQGFVGTQAYMAPEVFMKTNEDGHGRSADIWSVGCVVVEMASGKRPWAEYDSNYQIMFKVGMGETPDIPPNLSEEGQQFLSHCLQHDPRQRASAHTLLRHSFVKVDGDEEYLSNTLSSVLEEYLKIASRN